MVVGALGLNLLFGGSVDFRFAWDTFSFVVNIGALFAIPSVIVASAMASRVRGLLQTQQLPDKGLAA
jgi:hypothetical protein